MNKKSELQKIKRTNPIDLSGDLLQDLRSMIEQAQQSVAVAINSHLTALTGRLDIEFV